MISYCRKNSVFLASVFFGTLTVIFIAFIVKDNVDKLLAFSFFPNFHYGYIAAFFLSMSLSVLMIGYGWVKILKKFDPNLDASLITLFRIFFASWLARYIPTKMFSIVTRVTLTRRMNISGRAAIGSSVIDFTFQLFALILLGAPVIFLQLRHYISDLPHYLTFIVWLVAGILIIFVFVKKFRAIFTFLLKRYEKFNAGLFPNINPSLFLSIFPIYIAAMFFWGLSLFFLLRAFTPISFLNIFDVVSIASFASAIGFFIIFIPAGVGTREGILFFLLSAYAPLGAAAATPIIFRIGSILVEFILLTATYSMERIKGRRAPVA